MAPGFSRGHVFQWARLPLCSERLAWEEACRQSFRQEQIKNCTRTHTKFLSVEQQKWVNESHEEKSRVVMLWVFVVSFKKMMTDAIFHHGFSCSAERWDVLPHQEKARPLWRSMVRSAPAVAGSRLSLAWLRLGWWLSTYLFLDLFTQQTALGYQLCASLCATCWHYKGD